MEPHQIVIRAFLWLRSLLLMLEEPYVVAELEPRSAMYKVSALLIVLFFQFLILLLVGGGLLGLNNYVRKNQQCSIRLDSGI